MRSIALFGSLLVALFVLAACAPPAPPSAAPNVGVSGQAEPSTPPITPPPVFAPTDPAIRAAMDKASTHRSQGISYFYTKMTDSKISTEPSVSSNVWQRGDTVKLTPPLPTRYDKASVVHVVVLDTAAQTAVGYCTSTSICGNAVPEQRSASYATYAFITPFDWLDLFSDVQKAGEETMINSKLSYPITASVEGRTVQAWLDKFSGVPLEVHDGATVYRYDKLGLGVKDSELQP